jgi:hypothetical protein
LLAGVIKSTAAYRNYKRRRVEEAYFARMRRYREALDAKGLRYDEAETIERVRSRFPARNKRYGEIRTCYVAPSKHWHNAMVPHLERMGEVVHLDVIQEYMPDFDALSGAEVAARMREATPAILRRFDEAHGEKPFDWAFFYHGAAEWMAELATRVREKHGVPTAIMSLDDKQSWDDVAFGSERITQREAAPLFDVYWTNSSECCRWILAEGGAPIFMPEACDPDEAKPRAVEKRHDLLFIGAAYGFRKHFVGRLERLGIEPTVYGAGWGARGGFLPRERYEETLNASRVILGAGGVGYSEALMNVKGRDFELPAVGAAPYLTSYNPDLARWFEVGKEIFCYKDDVDLVEQFRYLIERPDVGEASARLARSRCLREHQWIHRYDRLLKILNVVGEEETPPVSEAEAGTDSSLGSSDAGSDD